MGFHVDGLAAEVVNLPAHLLVPVPDGVSWPQVACASVTFGTVQHMLFDNAKLEPGETILVHAAGSGVGSTAILMAKDIGATVFATAGDDERSEEHTSELQSLMRNSYAVFCLKKKTISTKHYHQL